MAERIKVGDSLFIDYADLGGAAPQEIISPTGGGGNWLYDVSQLSVFIQNRSGANMELSTQAGAANGILLGVNQGITFDLGTVDQSIWAVVSVGNVIIAIATMNCTD